MRPRWADELRVAFMLLSRLPAGTISGEAPPMATSSWAWPLVGAAVGAISALFCGVGLWFGLPPLMAAILALAAGVLATGAMHEDGLADLADGFGGGRDKAQKLEIMRDSRIGTYGVTALILSFGFRAGAISAVANAHSVTLALIGIAAATRSVLPALLLLMPPARVDGLGRAATMNDPKPAAAAAIIGILCLLPLGPGSALAVALGIVVAATLLAVLAARQIGGQTGDVLGASQQVCECTGWAILVSLL